MVGGMKGFLLIGKRHIRCLAVKHQHSSYNAQGSYCTEHDPEAQQPASLANAHANGFPNRIIGLLAQIFKPFSEDMLQWVFMFLFHSALSFCSSFPIHSANLFLAFINWVFDVFTLIPSSFAISSCGNPSITYRLKTVRYPAGNC